MSSILIAPGGGFNISSLKPRNGRPRTQVQHLMQIDLKGWGVGYVSSFQQHCLLQMLNTVAGNFIIMCFLYEKSFGSSMQCGIVFVMSACLSLMSLALLFQYPPLILSLCAVMVSLSLSLFQVQYFLHFGNKSQVLMY